SPPHNVCVVVVVTVVVWLLVVVIVVVVVVVVVSVSCCLLWFCPMFVSARRVLGHKRRKPTCPSLGRVATGGGFVAFYCRCCCCCCFCCCCFCNRGGGCPSTE
ncbi:unnamed protein product, partial [Polarella glacialis]